MTSLYRMVRGLPTVLATAWLAWSLTGCGGEPPPRESAAPPTNRYSDAIEQAEAAKFQVEARARAQRPDS